MLLGRRSPRLELWADWVGKGGPESLRVVGLRYLRLLKWCLLPRWCGLCRWDLLVRQAKGRM